MSLLRGSLSYKKYKINKKGEILSKENLEKFAFKTDNIGVAGFTSPFLMFDSENFYDVDLFCDYDDSFKNIKILGLRCDNYNFSASQMRPYIERKEFEETKKTGKSYVKSSRKKEIKEEVLRLFKANNFPKIEFCELLIKNEFIYLFSQKESLAKYLENIFYLLGYSIEEIILIDDSIDRKQTSIKDFIEVPLKGEWYEYWKTTTKQTIFNLAF